MQTLNAESKAIAPSHRALQQTSLLPSTVPQSSTELGAASRAGRMKAIVYHRYGAPDRLRIEEIDKPAVVDGAVRVRIYAAAANPYDWHFLRGEPYFMRLFIGLRRPKKSGLGVDFAGQVEAVGKGVTRFRPGDDVFGMGDGAFAEYLSAPESQVALKPSGLTFEQTAAIPMAGLTALQGLRDVGQLRSRQKLLIVGASGGVGTLAVQIARALGAQITGVCSTRNLERVCSLGAEDVIDYTVEDPFRSGRRWDVIFQLAGTRSPSDCRRALSPQGRLILSSGDANNRWLGPLGRLLKAALLSPFVSQTLGSTGTQRSGEDLEYLAGLIDAGQVTPIIDRAYPLDQIAEAIRYLEQGHAQGKVVITV